MRFVRLGLAVLAVGQLLPGVWAIANPAHFYASFPGPGSPWVAADGPFNHHLVVDTGAGLAATGAMLALAALWPRPQVRTVALIGYLVHALPHLVYHLGHPPAVLPSAEQVLTWAPSAAGVVLATGLLATGWMATTPRRSAIAQHMPADGPGAERREQGRIPGIEGSPRNLVLRIGFAAGRRRLGAVPASWRLSARVPRLALARMIGDAAHERARLIPEHLGALATLRAAMVVACPFCVDILSASAATQGVDPEQIRELAQWQDSDAFGDDERLVLALADVVSATPVEVPTALVDDLAERFGADGVVELASMLGHEQARARTNRIFGVSPQGFAAAASCPVPREV